MENNFAEFLKELRVRNGFSTLEVFKLATTISLSSLSKYEAGDSIPSFPNIVKLSHVLDVSYDDLINKVKDSKKVRWKVPFLSIQDWEQDKKIINLISDILQEYHEHDNTQIKDGLLELIRHQGLINIVYMVSQQINNRTKHIEHCKRQFPDFNHSSNWMSNKSIAVFILSKLYELYNSTNRFVFMNELSELLSKKNELKNNFKVGVELTNQDEYEFLIDGIKITQTEWERIIFLTRFEREHLFIS